MFDRRLNEFSAISEPDLIYNAEAMNTDTFVAKS